MTLDLVAAPFLGRSPRVSRAFGAKLARVEAALRDYVARELAGGLGVEGRPTGRVTAAISAALHRRLEIDPLTLLTRFERPLYADARSHLPLGAVVEASGLRVDFGDETVPERLVAHAEGCSVPYPVKLVVTKASTGVVGDVS